MKIGKGWSDPEWGKEKNDEFSDLSTSELKKLLKRIFESPKKHYLRGKYK